MTSKSQECSILENIHVEVGDTVIVNSIPGLGNADLDAVETRWTISEEYYITRRHL